MDDSNAPIPPSRRKFLVIVDKTPECRVALRFAARRAQRTGGIVTLLYIVPPADFQQWAGVERKMREEAREMGADEVVNVQFEHGEDGKLGHLTGLAVKYRR